jgi:hypothetical protein
VTQALAGRPTPGQAAVYRDGNWQIVADHRGETVYSVADGSATEIAELGGAVTQALAGRPTPCARYSSQEPVYSPVRLSKL